MKYVITDKISIEDIKSIIFENRQIELSKESVARIQKCRDYLDNKMKTQKEPIYGVTTGFGSLCNATRYSWHVPNISIPPLVIFQTIITHISIIQNVVNDYL